MVKCMGPRGLRDLTELSNQVGLSCIGSPFTVKDVSIILHHETELFVTSAKLFQPTFCVIDRLNPALSPAEAFFQRAFEWFKPRVDLKDA